MTGGNHIKNLLTTSSLFSEYKPKDYLKSYYTYKLNKDLNKDEIIQGKSVHIHEKNNSFVNVYRDSNNFKQKLCKLVCGHIEEYETHILKTKIRNNFFKYLPYTISCIITAPKNSNGRLYKRLKYFHDHNNYITQLSLENYSLPLKLVGYNLFDLSNSIILNSDILGKSEGSYYFQEVIFSKLNLQLPNEIHELHQLWINMIDRTLENK